MIDVQKTAMLLPYEFEQIFKSLPLEQAGLLILALYQYEHEEVEPDFSDNEILQFSWKTHIKPKIDEYKEKYKKTCEVRREAGSKGGKSNQEKQKQAKQANATFDKQNEKKVANQADIDRDIDGDIDRDNNINNTNVLFDQQELVEQDKPKSEYSEIMEAWNRLPVTNIKAIKGTRLMMLKARLKDYTIDEILSAISNIRESPFLLGQNNKGWQITFDWFIKPNNFVKVYEGNYTGQRQTKSSTSWNDTQAGYNGVMERLGGIVDE